MTLPISAWTQGALAARAAAALVHLLWQGALLLLLREALEPVLARRPAQWRYAASCAALLLLVLSPVATWVWLPSSGRGETPAIAATPVATRAGSSLPSKSDPRPTLERLAALVREAPAIPPPARPWLLGGWLAGVAALSLRMARSWSAAAGLTRRGRAAGPRLEAVARDVAERLGIRRPLRILTSRDVSVPSALGTFSPVVLVPAAALTGFSPEHLGCLLAHELAHVRRHDYLVNLLQCAAETLFFYHPAVWRLSRRIRTEREECCDDLAVAAIGDAAAYARALVRLDEIRGPRRTVALAATGDRPGSLASRVTRLFSAPARPSPLPAAIAGTIAVGALASIGAIVHWDGNVAALSAPEPSVAVAAVRAVSPAAAARVDPATAAAPVRVARQASPGRRPSPARPAEATPPVEADRQPSPDELSEFAIHGVTPEFIDAIARAGYPHPSPDDLVALRIHGIGPEYLTEMKGLFGSLSLDDAIALKIHGATREFVAAFRSAGYDRISADDAVALRIHGVEASDVSDWKTLGFSPSLDDLVALRIHGARPEFARALRQAGLPPASVDDLVAFRIHGVTPEFVRDLASSGYAKLTGDDVVAFRIHGVSTEFVRALQGMGYHPDPDDLVAFRIHGVTPEFIRAANARRGRTLSADELVALRIHGGYR